MNITKVLRTPFFHRTPLVTVCVPNKIVQIFGCIIGRIVNRINSKMSFFHNKENVVKKYIENPSSEYIPMSYNR